MVSNLSSASSELLIPRLMGVPLAAPFAVSEDNVDSVLILEFSLGDAFGDCFICGFDGSGERGGALIIAGWGGIWEEGL